MRWCILYGDETTWSDVDSGPQHAPATDVQVIAVDHPVHGRQIVHGHDFYWWADGQWYGGDLAGLLDYHMHHDGWSKVLLARSRPTDTYRELVTRALTIEW